MQGALTATTIAAALAADATHCALASHGAAQSAVAAFSADATAVASSPLAAAPAGPESGGGRRRL